MAAIDPGPLLAAGRAAHEALMGAAGDRIRIQRPTPGAFDQATGQDTPGTPLVLYEGPARVRPMGRGADSEVQAGEQEVRLRDYQVAVPWAATVPPGEVIKPGDQIVMLAAADSRLSDSTLWVTGRQFSSLATAWRIYAEDREAGTA
jgi:hypothetical protein